MIFLKNQINYNSKLKNSYDYFMGKFVLKEVVIKVSNQKIICEKRSIKNSIIHKEKPSN